jgi:hypothetical protein
MHAPATVPSRTTGSAERNCRRPAAAGRLKYSCLSPKLINGSESGPSLRPRRGVCVVDQKRARPSNTALVAFDRRSASIEELLLIPAVSSADSADAVRSGYNATSRVLGHICFG